MTYAACESSGRHETWSVGRVLDTACQLHGPVLGPDEVLVEIPTGEHEDAGPAVLRIE